MPYIYSSRDEQNLAVGCAHMFQWDRNVWPGLWCSIYYFKPFGANCQRNFILNLRSNPDCYFWQPKSKRVPKSRLLLIWHLAFGIWQAFLAFLFFKIHKKRFVRTHRPQGQHFESLFWIFSDFTSKFGKH